MNSIRMFRDFVHLQRWQREILKREDATDGLIVRGFRMIPWTGVCMVFFVLLFFGVDVGAGVTQTAKQLREKKDEAQANIELQKAQAKQWSRDQYKDAVANPRFADQVAANKIQ